MKILVLGSEGFIGSNMVAKLVEAGHEITGCDLYEFSSYDYHYIKVDSQKSQWENIFAIVQPEVCVNASGKGNVPFSVEHPLIDFKANTAEVTQVLDAIRMQCGECKYLHISSAAVYGNPKHLPVKETDSLQPISPYGFHKWMSEIICQEFYQLFQVPITIIRPFSVYGAGLRKQLFWDICNKMKDKETDEIVLYGSGNQSRDFIYISDLVELMYTIITKDNFKCNIYNAASGTETILSGVTKLIQQKMNQKPIRFSGETRTGDPLNWHADISRISALGYCPKVSIISGIQQYIDWFLQQTIH